MASAAAHGGSRRRCCRERQQRFMQWWLHSTFQAAWMRLAIQCGVCTLLILSIFNTPVVWELHTFDPILANPVLVLVIANVGLLFTANTGFPIFKLDVEIVVGSLAGGVATYGVIYLVQAISGGSNEPSVLKAAMLLLFGSVLMMLATASRFRWPQHIAFAGLTASLTLSVGLAVMYHMEEGLWRFVLYWWWFVGLACLFSMGVGMTVLPLPAGWVVRKQLARALRQEGAVLEVIVRLLTAEDPATCDVHTGSGSSSRDEHATGGRAGGQEVAAGASAAAAGAEEEADFPPSPPLQEEGAGEFSSLVGTLRRLWHAGRRSGLRRATSLGASFSRISLVTRRGSRGDLAATAKALGIRPDLYPAVEPIYGMSEPTAASLQAAWTHMRFTSFEIDLYRPTRLFPSLAYRRLLLLARILLSSAMAILYSLQSGAAKLGPSREHAGHLQRTAAEIKGCCQCLAAVLRNNAPVGPALQQLGQLELAFWELQQAVTALAMPAAAAHSVAKHGMAAAEEAVEGRIAAGNGWPDENSPGNRSRAQHQPDTSAPTAVSAFSGEDAAEVAQDSLALHLSLSMIFTCCTKVRAMYQLLPQAVANDQQGVGDAVAAHFATANTWDAVLRARTMSDAPTPMHGASDIYRRSQLLWGGQLSRGGLQSSRSIAALDKLARPTVHVAQRVKREEPAGFGVRISRLAQRAFGAIERATGFCSSQVSLGLQMGVAFLAVMLLVVVPSMYEALNHRSVWAVFIIVVVHEPLAGSVVRKSVQRFGGTVVAGILGLGALYFAFLCNGLSFENRPAKFISMTAALVVCTMLLAAGAARYGLQNSYSWIVSCVIMYTVALPGYAHNSPMPTLALWRLACTAIGIGIELLVALIVFPVTAREAAQSVTAGALREMADVAEKAFLRVLPAGAEAASVAAAGEGSYRGLLPRRFGRDAGSRPSSPPPPSHSRSGSQTLPVTAQPAAEAPPGQQMVVQAPTQPDQQQALPPASIAQGSPGSKPAVQQQKQQQHVAHTAINCTTGGWHGREVAHGAVLTRIHQSMMEACGQINTLRTLLGPLRVEYHPLKQPPRFPVRAGCRAQRLCRRTLNILTCFALAMDSHHTESVPLLAPHTAELEGLVAQLREALLALAAMVGGSVSLENAVRTVAALEKHTQALMLRVLLNGPRDGLSTSDTTQGLAFMAMLFNVTSVARHLCLALGEAFCSTDVEGLSVAVALLRDSPDWAVDEQLRAVAAGLMSEALACAEEEEPVVGL